MAVTRKLPGLPRILCTCGESLMPGFPLVGRDLVNLTACASCERTFTLDADHVLTPIDIASLGGVDRERAIHAENLCRKIHGRPPRTLFERKP